MSYQSDESNAMILPIPVRLPAEETSVKFVELSHYASFFSDLARGFPYVQKMSFGCSAETKTTSRADLKVFQVGSYIASFVPNLSDFSRLDERFRLPDAVWSKLPQYRDFGFVVFQLAEGAVKPHPMAFEFQSRTDKVFFPTVHVHDGEVHATETFDHILYLQHAGLDSRVGHYENNDVPDPETKLVRSRYVASRFVKIDQAPQVFAPNLLMHRRVVQGVHANRDIEFVIDGHPLQTAMNWRPWLAWTPWLLVASGLAWLIGRRSKLLRS